MNSAPEMPKPGTVKRTLLSGNPAHTERPAKILASLERSQSVAISGTRKRPPGKAISYHRYNNRRVWGGVARGAMAVVAAGLLLAIGLAVYAQWKSPLFATQHVADNAMSAPDAPALANDSISGTAPSWSTADRISPTQTADQISDSAPDQTPDQLPDVANIITVPSPTHGTAVPTQPVVQASPAAAPVTLAAARPASAETNTTPRVSTPARTTPPAQRASKTTAAPASAAAASSTSPTAPDSDVDLLAALLSRLTQRDPAPPIQPATTKAAQDLRATEPCTTAGSNAGSCAHP